MERLQIAKIIKPQGIHGDVKLAMFVHDLDLQNLPLFVDGKPAKVQKVYSVGGTLAAKFDIIDSRQDAENYRNKVVEVEKDAINVPAGKFLVADLIGKLAVLESGKVIGKVEGVFNFGSADIISIKSDKEVLCSHKIGLIVSVNEQKIVMNDKIFDEVAVYED